ncbi:unnamed protein product [Paramecium octaurelia]|uniref:TLDc domain-containing protein n=1 Tax=Paramecium octaurelia TaxID=43137 RepID=A0A8S1XVN4_PAROT|nr:unnamed protein product [Paramecium octaurelia]
MKKIPCFKHEDQFLFYIKLGQNQTELICQECAQELKYGPVDTSQQNLIHLNKVLDSPEHLLSKLNLKPSLKEFFTYIDKFNEKTIPKIFLDFKIKITKLQNTMQDLQKEVEENLALFLNMKQKIRNELLNINNKIINFDQFKQLIGNIEQIGDSINNQTIEQNERGLHQYILDLNKNNCKELNIVLLNILNGIKRETKNLNEEQCIQSVKFNEQFKTIDHCKSELMDLSQLLYFEEQILSDYYKLKIINKIESTQNKRICCFKPIFLSNRDGLSGYNFRSKVKGKSNLLMIFKSKSGYIFGGYTPCKWNYNLNSYVQDDTLSSFLFSQTHDEIYPVKRDQQAYAIHCNQTYGPIFGAGHDLCIGSDFQSGSSNFGHSYWCEDQYVAKNTHLFGQSTPNVEECEIFEVLFI